MSHGPDSANWKRLRWLAAVVLTCNTALLLVLHHAPDPPPPTQLPPLALAEDEFTPSEPNPAALQAGMAAMDRILEARLRDAAGTRDVADLLPDPALRDAARANGDPESIAGQTLLAAWEVSFLQLHSASPQ